MSKISELGEYSHKNLSQWQSRYSAPVYQRKGWETLNENKYMLVRNVIYPGLFVVAAGIFFLFKILPLFIMNTLSYIFSSK